MSGDCFWTALVNCFDDCGAAPPPPPPPPDAALYDGFYADLDGRAPEVPANFSSVVDSNVFVEDGLAKHNGGGGLATAGFSGDLLYKTAATRVFRAGLRFDAADLNRSSATVSFDVGESWEVTNPRAQASMYATFQPGGSATVFSNTSCEVLGFDFSTGEVTDGIRSFPGDVYTTADVWSAGPGVTHELRLEVDASGFRGYMDGGLLFSSTWESGSFTRALTPDYAGVSFSRGVYVDYIQLDLDE